MGTDPTVLVVDDDALIRAIIKDGLPQCQVVEAKDGREAIDLLDKTHPDLVILDLFMPRLGGLEALREIRGKSKVRIVVLSSMDAKDLMEQAIEAGANRFVVKPVHPLELAEEVERLHQGASHA